MSFMGKMVGTAAVLLSLAAPAFAADTEVRFYFPVAVNGPITKIIDEYAADFEKANPGIKVKPVYAGDYVQTVAKALTAMKGGDTPELAILQAADLMTLTDEGAVVPLDDFIKTADDKAWISGFYPGFMENAKLNGKTYAIPFQRSTPVLYWNKAAFKEAGLDPEKGPANWAEMTAFAKKLTKKDAQGNVSQWGLQIPSDGNTQWLFSGLTITNDVRLANPEGTKVNFNHPKVIEAAQYFHSMKTEGYHPPGLTAWGTTPRDFAEGKAAMIWHTTGSLTSIRSMVKFDFGVGFLPANAHYGAPTGGGNFYMFKGLSAEKQQAAFKFIRFMTTPERAADWSIKTGYVATSPAAYATEAMKAYTAGFPQATVARDQLQYAWSELTTHDNQRVGKALSDALQAILTGAKPAAAALNDAQKEAERLLKEYQ